jgi:hypothetical protein
MCQGAPGQSWRVFKLNDTLLAIQSGLYSGIGNRTARWALIWHLRDDGIPNRLRPQALQSFSVARRLNLLHLDGRNRHVHLVKRFVK